MGIKNLYYINTFKNHKYTTKASRGKLRNSLERDKMMGVCLEDQRGKCFYCSVAIGMDAHLDHVLPIYYGGTNSIHNLVGACRDCNLLKSTAQIEITNKRTIRKFKKAQRKLQLWEEELQKAYDINKQDRYLKLRCQRPKVDKKYRPDIFVAVCYNNNVNLLLK